MSWTTTNNRKGGNIMKVQVKNIGPSEASALLARNVANRPLRPRYVESLSRQMQDGYWQLVGDPIRIAEDGRLLDGQHRLHAILTSGTTQQFVMVDGLDERAQLAMDSGIRRSFADILQMAGESNCRNIAAVTRLALMRDLGYSYSDMAAGSVQFGSSELQATLDKHPELRDAAREGQSAFNAMRIPASFAGFGWWEFGHINADDRDEFYRKIREKDFFGPTDPVSRLYTTMLENAASSRDIPRLTKFALFIKTWNHFRDGTEGKVLYWRRGGANPESFPTPY
jgi:hypothetical protein